ncbi:MAG: WD40 repeat domain-containing protein [Myxococcota bacterium]|nr:WD40 repeat domain-containing protein [Myxococcota bacterium]
MMLWLLALGCSTPPEPTGELIFVRDGVIAPDTANTGQPIGNGRRLIERAWTAGETVSMAGLEATAPVRPECIPLFHVPLSDVSRLTVTGGVAPNSSVAFSPDGTRLAIGSHQGDLVVVDGWTGEEKARTRLPEALTKNVAWSPDGATLYAGEQSPDAALHAFDADTLTARWSFRAADRVGSTPLPEGEDRYAIYNLPGIYSLDVMANGDIVAVAVHGWNDAEGTRLNLSQVIRLTPDGDVRGQWPENAESILLMHSMLRTDADGTPVLVTTIGRSADGPPPTDLPTSGVSLIDLDAMALKSTARATPLAPWFKQVSLWHAVDWDPTLGLMMGLGDGRVIRTDAASPHTEQTTVQTGAPVMAGDVPIAASVGFGQFAQGGLMYTTSDTNIPWGAAVPELRPPSVHPGANGLWMSDLSGAPQWSWQGNIRVQGLSVSPDGRRGIVGAGHRAESVDPLTYGAVVFDLTTPNDGRTGAARRVTTCATTNPVYFNHQILDDGRIAVVEFPTSDGQGGVRGSYRATVLR